MSDFGDYFTPASEAHQKKEKAKAREMRQSNWWKQQLGQGICYHCEKKFKPEELTMDHLIPIVRGGKTDKKNCVPSCKDCNSKKGYKTRAELALEALKQSTETQLKIQSEIPSEIQSEAKNEIDDEPTSDENS